MIDEELDARGRIVPGLGDAGDRAFGNAARAQQRSAAARRGTCERSIVADVLRR
jgi:hypothetical protein